MKHLSIEEILGAYTAADKHAGAVYISVAAPARAEHDRIVAAAASQKDTAIEQATSAYSLALSELVAERSRRVAEIYSVYEQEISKPNADFAAAKKRADDTWYAATGAVPGVCKTPPVEPDDVLAEASRAMSSPELNPLSDAYAIAITRAKAKLEAACKPALTKYNTNHSQLLVELGKRQVALNEALEEACKQARQIYEAAELAAQESLHTVLKQAEAAFNGAREDRHALWMHFTGAYERALSGLNQLAG